MAKNSTNFGKKTVLQPTKPNANKTINMFSFNFCKELLSNARIYKANQKQQQKRGIMDIYHKHAS